MLENDDNTPYIENNSEEPLDIVDNALDIDTGDITNAQLSKLFNLSTKQISRDRAAGYLPPNGSSLEDVCRHLLNKAKNPVSEDSKEQKLKEEVRRLQIDNDKKEGRYVEKDKVIEYFGLFANHVKQTIIQESENLESNIVCPNEVKADNIKIIQSSRNNILGLISAFGDFK